MGKLQIMGREWGHGTLEIDNTSTLTMEEVFDRINDSEDKTAKAAQGVVEAQFTKLLGEGWLASKKRPDGETEKVESFDPEANILMTPVRVGG